MTLKYRREIDGLRAVAVLPVIFFHAKFRGFSGGFVGVDVFFVISGFLITSQILEAKNDGTFSLATFYMRRARRILPALLVVVLACIPLAWLWLLPNDLEDFSKSVLYLSFFSANVLFYQQSGYFDAAAELKPLLHTWSLSVEEQYYIIFPMLVIALWAWWGKKRIFGAFVFLGLVSLVLAQHEVGIRPEAAFYLLPYRAWELLLGASAAWLVFSESKFLNIGRLAEEAVAFLGLALILAAVFAFNKATPFPGMYALVPTVGAAMILLFATPHTMTGRILGGRVFVGIGLISYSAYLWHQPLFVFARLRTGDQPGSAVLLLLGCLSMLLAYMSWRFVELPFRNRNRISGPVVVKSAVFGTVTLIVLGSVALANRGFESRFDANDRPLATIRRAEAGKYVSDRFVKLRLKKFAEGDSRKKIFLIGDSFGQDLANAIYESGMSDRIQLSTHSISARCGNLYLESDFTAQIRSSDLNACLHEGWYEDKHVKELLSSADEIWLASSWLYWQAKLLPESVRNIETDFGKKVSVFGAKSFGRINIRRLLTISPDQRQAIRNKLSNSRVEVNRLMKKTLPASVFVDLIELLCNSETECPIFLKDGTLISYDGSHLTAGGARYLGHRLLELPRFSQVQAHAPERASGPQPSGLPAERR